MNNIEKTVAIIIVLAIGAYAGYWFTADYYKSENSDEAKRDDTAICRLEIRDGKRGDVKERYIAMLEYRTEDGGKEFCKEHMPEDALPDSTALFSFDGLYSEEDYEARIPPQEP